MGSIQTFFTNRSERSLSEARSLNTQNFTITSTASLTCGVIADKDVQMIDACHIVPFAQSGDDTISNGLSLCPNLHRAFDRGLIAISDEYRVLVKPFYEVDDNVYSIKQFEGKKIFLPKEKVYCPLAINLAKHRHRFVFDNSI
jgi:putative restriction endonuclease